MPENISAISYTNKDFQTIYPELLDLATRISKRWTPDKTNESDPGIVLTKLMAICADKNNYNIDKNVLEYFPSSVTQLPNAREVFSQRGYYMRWYNTADGEITVSAKSGGGLSNLDGVDYVTIDAVFPAVTGADGATVYTIHPESVNRAIKTDGSSTTFRVLQGVAKQYKTVIGSADITVADLDAEKRLYFPNNSVAENGIFIKTTAGGDFSKWVRVDSIDSEPLGSTVYEFGVSRDGENCYIQFPDDITSLIGNGINLWYIETGGVAGNVGAGYLTKFATDVNGKYTKDGQTSTILLNSDNIVFSQSSSFSNGADPETIEEAYRGYKKTIGTFDTLVTLRDYNNAMYRSEIVPNGFVTDRTNDVQRAYNIVSESNDINVINAFTSSVGEKETMSAFDLCLYVFQGDNGEMTSESAYNSTFKIANNYIESDGTKKKDQCVIDLENWYAGNNKSIQHDFVSWKTDKPLMIKNKYVVRCNIIPQYSVTALQAGEIQENVKNALYKGLNSSKVDFGEEVTYDRVYNIILGADERIKSVSLYNIEFTPYAAGVDSSNNPYETELKSLSGATEATAKTDEYAKSVEVFARSVLNGNTPLFNQDKNIDYSIAQTSLTDITDTKTVSTETEISLGSTDTTLLKNEAVVFYAPSLVDDTVYSLGVKYLCDVAVDANATKKPKVFVALWKKDGAFYAHKYDGVYIIPSFNIAQNDTAVTLAEKIATSGKDVDISGVSDITGAWGSIPQIAVNQSITTKTVNEQTTRTTDYCSWILNNIDYSDNKDGEWVLFPSYSASFSFEDTWKDGNGNQLQFTKFGANTTVSGNISRTEIEATEISVTDTANATFRFPSQGENQTEYSLTISGWDMTVKFGSTSLVLSHEAITQQHSLAPGEYLITSDSQKQNMTIFGAGTLLSRTVVANTPKLSIPYASYGMSNVSSDGMKSLGSSQLVSGVSITATERQYIAVGEGVNLTATTAVTINNTEVGVNDKGIVYGNDNKTLPVRDADIGWTARSFLSFNTMGGAMKLSDSRQKVWFNNSATKYTAPNYIQTSPQYNLSGGENLNIQYYTEQSTGLQKPSVVVYEQPTTPTGYTINENGSVVVGSGDSTFSVPNTSYDRLFRVTKRFGEEFSFEGLVPLNTSETKKKTVVYYRLKKSSSSGATQYTVTAGASGATISVLRKINPYDSSVLGTGVDEVVLNKVQGLDQDGLFNYMYEVPTDRFIKDPLLGESFMNPVHPYNKFTICQMNTPVEMNIMNKLSAR